MPAAPYFVSVQLALIIASAALVKVGWKKDKQAAPAPDSSPPPIAAIPVSPELLRAAKEMPGGSIDRFALMERAPEATAQGPDSRTRRMGYRDERESRQRPDEVIQATNRDAQPARSSAPDDLPSFDPVPADAGYHIAADAATNFDLDSQTVAFSGNVSLKCADFTLTARRLVVHMEKGSQTLKKLVANGSVDIHLTGVPKEEAYHSQSEEAIFDPATNTIVLSGWPKINGKGREHIAATPVTKMTLHTKASKLVTDGRAQTRLVFDGKNGLPGVTLGSPSAPPPPRKG